MTGLPKQFFNITFLPPREFFQRTFAGAEYRVIGEDDVGNFVGEAGNGTVYLLDTAEGADHPLVYLARDRRTLAAAVKIYRRHRGMAMAAAFLSALVHRGGDNEEEQARKEAAGLGEKLSALDPEMLRDEFSFWSPLLEEIEWGML